jgi:calcineurin-like phosphoesterase family protein
MSRTWFTSDTHFRHPNVARRRGFDTAEEHDEEIARRWNARVRPDDTVWHLGDVGRGGDRYEDVLVLSVVAGLNGTKHLVLGNHDAPHPLHSDSHKHQRRWLEVFDSVQSVARRKWEGETVLLSHFPYTGDHTTVDRHPEFRLPDKGFRLLHGHLHGHRPHLPRMVDVGVDMWDFAPVPVETVMGLLFQTVSS